MAPRPLPLLLLALATMGAGAAPAVNPAAGRFVVAGITVGMSLPQALGAMHETFGIEGLEDVHIMTASSHTEAGGQTLRLSVAQQASTKASAGVNYREDRFKLRLAGPAGDPVVTAVTRDYLAPEGLDRATILRTLLHKYGPPTSSYVPGAAVPTGSTELIWVITPGGGVAGGGAQYSTEARCGTALTQYSDYFDNARDSNSDLAELIKTHRGSGCGLVMQVDFSYNAVHYEMYDTTAAAAALGPVVKAAGVKAAPGGVVLRY